MNIGVPYRDALDMPIDMALALLSPSDERQNNTRQANIEPAPRPIRKTQKSGTTYIATRFKNAENKP